MKIVLLLMITSSISFAKDVKIAFVNTQGIIVKWQKEIDTQLQDKFKSKKNEILNLQEKIRNRINKLNQDASIMSTAVVNSTKKELDEMNVKYQALANDFQTNYNVEGKKLLKDRMVYLENAVNQVASEQKIDIVLQKNTALFTGKTLDITTSVRAKLKLLDKKT